MKLSEKKNSNFTPHPETEGPIKAVLVDVTELKKRMTQYGEKEEFRLVFETEVMDEENDRRFCIWSRRDLKKLMGRDLTSNELNEFDLEALIGHGVKLIIQHETKDDKTYANISFMAPDRDKATLKPSGKYTRIRDREIDGAAAGDSEEKSEEPGWESVEIHVGKYKGKKLGEVDEAGVSTLIEKWLPKAKADGKAEDAALVAALTELADILGGDEY
jgi:hypothetical protein